MAHTELDEILSEAGLIDLQLASKSIVFDRSGVISYFVNNYHDHYDKLCDPDIPSLVWNWNNNGDNGYRWTRAGKKNRRGKSKNVPMIERWVNGEDLIETQDMKELVMNPSKRKKVKDDAENVEKIESENPYAALDNEDDSDDSDDDNDDLSSIGSASDEEQDIIDVNVKDWITSWEMPTTRRNLEELKVLD